ncbi:hypothetical protein AB0H03_32975 [Streptomyces sparsogenes]|uniref:hypothetical protein n=1 Tax=Streptomyces sparsogenes TaxID=67365 RepID=UPI0033EFC970
MKFRKTLSAFAVAVAAAGAPLLAAPSAGAATTADWWDEQMHTDDSDPGGRVRFKADGDKVELCDIEADGWKVNLTIIVPGTHTPVDKMSVGGTGNCVTHTASNGHNLKENEDYIFRIYLSNSNNSYAYADESIWQA